jgi:hypothetical protein
MMAVEAGGWRLEAGGPRTTRGPGLSGQPPASSLQPPALLISILLLACTLLPAGEELVCRGFPASDAVAAVIGHTGTLLPLGPDLADRRGRRLWFALPDRAADPARQALAHGLGCWWSAAGLSNDPRFAGGAVEVRTYPPLPAPLPGAERLVRQALDPWLGGNGGLAQDFNSGGWSATTSPLGQARLENLLAALGDPHPRAPHLLPDPMVPSANLHFTRMPEGSDLASWCIDLMRVSGLAVALAADVDPQAPAIGGACTTLGEAMDRLAQLGLHAAVWHRCITISAAAAPDRRHPAERAAVAILPAGHLCQDTDQLGRFSAQLGARVRPGVWDSPGWLIAPLPTRLDLLVIADPATIHAVMEAMEAADQVGLSAWLR